MAEFVKGEAPSQKRDSVGLVVGLFFAVVGVTYLVGGHHALSHHWAVVLAAGLVLLGGAGLVGSGVFGAGPRAAAEPAPVSVPPEDELPAPE